ncbi:class I SAM-dependent methyltransferase [Thiomicrorhabdus aquaedulcis]|uniref:class I SAM-dependent methyltransferase n=1 Tax=Thiomicrorhabdus aquaedulcis TaxID=2211106 RepID=UPI0015621436|nr:methyltransferase domain-containing protein [Thiomicrorhabdus aquaedulcis]
MNAANIKVQLKLFLLVATRPLVLTPRHEYKRSHDYSAGFVKADKSYHEGYHASFDKRPGRKMIWEFEQAILRKIVEDSPAQTHLDFAGGTGRIAKVLEDFVPQQFVLDISEGMLAVAAQHLTKAKILNCDFSKGVPEIEDNSLDLVTAFRFFPNAEVELRESAMAFLVQKMQCGGKLVCNNHRSFWSLSYLLSRLLFKGGDVGMANNEMEALAKRHGLVLQKYYSVGVVPQNENKSLFSWALTQKIENYFFKHFLSKQRLGYNTIFVFEKLIKA